MSGQLLLGPREESGIPTHGRLRLRNRRPSRRRDRWRSRRGSGSIGSAPDNQLKTGKRTVIIRCGVDELQTRQAHWNGALLVQDRNDMLVALERAGHFVGDMLRGGGSRRQNDDESLAISDSRLD